MSSNSLKEIITAITSIYESLNELADLKTQVLKTNDIKTLDSIIRQEDQHNKKIFKLLQARDEYFSNNNSLNDFEKKELEDEIERLKNNSSDFAKKNELNHSLLQQSLYYVNMNLSMLSPQGDSDTYSPQNRNNVRKPNRSLIDSRV